MNQLTVGLIFVLFGFFIGGAGVATAGIGIGIPMIPIGLYLIFRGFRSFIQEKEMEKKDHYVKQKSFESTRFGKFCFGVVLILVGVATSALIIGIPIVFIGVFLVFRSFTSKKQV